MPKALKNIEILENNTLPDEQQGRITRLERLRVRHLYEDGSSSRAYNLDIVTHRGVDAVGVIPYFKRDGEIYVTLLRSFRPALHFRKIQPEERPFLVEIIAGVLEDGEHNPNGVIHRAVMELMEEAGIEVTHEQVHLLGGEMYSSPGLYTEKLWLCAAEFDPERRKTPSLDGSVMEEMIEAFDVPLARAREMCLSGDIKDAKTEVALERLNRLVANADGRTP